MSASTIGIGEVDWTENALEDLGQTITRTPRTAVTSNNTGSKTFTSGTTATFTAIFTRRSQTYDWNKEGLFQSGDAIMFYDKDQTLNKEDYCTVDSLVYRVDTIIERQAGGVDMFKTCNLFLVT